jgi:cyclopropane fatty-acyl-phospholipid synthase-like methyltransferase
MVNQIDYWEARFSQGEIWGKDACESAILFSQYISKFEHANILVPGCGYGRNAIYFANKGHRVKGIDYSHNAITLANSLVNQSKLALQVSFSVADINTYITEDEELFDCIYLSNVIHLLNLKERDNLFQHIYKKISDQGYLSFTCISTTDEHYGQGEPIGKNTYRMADGKEIHFFEEGEIVSLLEKNFNIEVIQLMNQEEPNSKGQLETLALWYIVAQKR